MGVSPFSVAINVCLHHFKTNQYQLQNQPKAKQPSSSRRPTPHAYLLRFVEVAPERDPIKGFDCTPQGTNKSNVCFATATILIHPKMCVCLCV